VYVLYLGLGVTMFKQGTGRKQRVKFSGIYSMIPYRQEGKFITTIRMVEYRGW
jgi:hypothetical protein